MNSILLEHSQSMTIGANEVVKMDQCIEEISTSKECQQLLFKNRNKDALQTTLNGDLGMVGCGNSMNDLCMNQKQKIHIEEQDIFFKQAFISQSNPNDKKDIPVGIKKIQSKVARTILSQQIGVFHPENKEKVQNDTADQSIYDKNKSTNDRNILILSREDEHNIDLKKNKEGYSALNFICQNSSSEQNEGGMEVGEKEDQDISYKFYKQSTSIQRRNEGRQSKKQIQWAFSIQAMVRTFIKKLQQYKNNRSISSISNLQLSLIQDLSSVEKESSNKNNNVIVKEIYSLLRQFQCIKAFMPTSTFKVGCDIFLIINIYLFFLIFSISIFFNSESVDSVEMSLYFCWILLLLGLDILLNLNTAFYKDEIIVTHHILIFKEYFSSFLCFSDFMSFFIICSKTIFQIDYITYNPEFYFWRYFYNLIAFLKLYSAYRKTKNCEDYFMPSDYQRQFYRLFRQIFNLIIIAHIASIGWYFVGLIQQLNYPDKLNWLQVKDVHSSSYQTKYIYSLYWAVVTMTTVGYGDITASNSIEALYITVNIILFSIVFAYSINNIGKILHDLEKTKKQLQNDISTIQKIFFLTYPNLFKRYLVKKQVNPSLISRVRHQLNLQYEESKERNIKVEQHILTKLSSKLREDITKEINTQVLQKFTIFNNFSQKSRLKLLQIMKEILVSPNEVIFEEGDLTDSSIYLIQNGLIEIYAPHVSNKKGQQRISMISDGQLFGELSFFTGYSRTASARSLKLSTLFKIEKQEFLQIIKENQADFEMFHLISHSLRFSQSQKILSTKCYSCNKIGHIARNCPDIHQCFDSQLIALRSNFWIFQDRNEFMRKKRKYVSARKQASSNIETVEKVIQNLGTEFTQNLIPEKQQKRFQQKNKKRLQTIMEIDKLMQVLSHQTKKKENGNGWQDKDGVQEKGIQETEEEQEEDHEDPRSGFHTSMTTNSANSHYQNIFNFTNKFNYKDFNSRTISNEITSPSKLKGEKKTCTFQITPQYISKTENDFPSPKLNNEDSIFHKNSNEEIASSKNDQSISAYSRKTSGQMMYQQPRSMIFKNTNTLNSDDTRRLASKSMYQIEEESINITRNMMENENSDRSDREASSEQIKHQVQLQFQQSQQPLQYTQNKYLMEKKQNQNQGNPNVFTFQGRPSIEKEHHLLNYQSSGGGSSEDISQNSITKKLMCSLHEINSMNQTHFTNPINSGLQQSSIPIMFSKSQGDLNKIINTISCLALSEFGLVRSPSIQQRNLIIKHLQNALMKDNKFLQSVASSFPKQEYGQNLLDPSLFDRMQAFKTFFPQFNFSRVLKKFKKHQACTKLTIIKRKGYLLKNNNQNRLSTGQSKLQAKCELQDSLIESKRIKNVFGYRPTQLSYGISLPTCSKYPIIHTRNQN